MSVAEIVAHRAGVITRRQALAAGMSRRTVQRRVASGAWAEILPGVYLVDGHLLTDEARALAAALWAAGTGGLLSGPAAAFWLGMLPAAPKRIEVTLPLACHRSRPAGLVIRRRDLHAADVALFRGVPVTDLPLTALETAVVLPDGSTFLDRALQRHVRFPALYRAYCRNLGRRGSEDAGRLIAAAADRADSAAERLLLRILRRGGVTGWVAGLPFGPHLIDVAFPAARLAVEVDGWAWHVDAARFRGDRRKGNALVGAGWSVLRFTWHDLTQRPGECLAEVRRALARAAA